VKVISRATVLRISIGKWGTWERTNKKRMPEL